MSEILEETKAPALVKNQVTVGKSGLQLSTLDDMWRFANCVVKAGLAPKGFDKPEGVLIALEMGMEIGLPPMSALQNIAVINGRPGVWGDAQAAVCFNSGLLEGGIEDEYSGSALKDDWTCRVRVRRKGVEKPYVGEFSYGEAKLAGLLTKESWAKYPRKMLFARARSDALRKAFPDVLKGIRSAEEMEDISDAAPTASKSKLFGGAKREKAETKPAEDVEVVNAPTAEGGAKVEKSDDLKPKSENALEELRLKMEAEGLSDAQLMEYARRQESILLADGTLDEFGAKKILNAWGVVREIIATMPNA